MRRSNQYFTNVILRESANAFCSLTTEESLDADPQSTRIITSEVSERFLVALGMTDKRLLFSIVAPEVFVKYWQ